MSLRQDAYCDISGGPMVMDLDPGTTLDDGGVASPPGGEQLTDVRGGLADPIQKEPSRLCANPNPNPNPKSNPTSNPNSNPDKKKPSYLPPCPGLGAEVDVRLVELDPQPDPTRR